jgi:hypothetical protein
MSLSNDVNNSTLIHRLWGLGQFVVAVPFSAPLVILFNYWIWCTHNCMYGCMHAFDCSYLLLEYWPVPHMMSTHLHVRSCAHRCTHIASTHTHACNHTHMHPRTHVHKHTHTRTGKEVLQAAVEDVASFKIWAKEAFQLWESDWAACYEVCATLYVLAISRVLSTACTLLHDSDHGCGSKRTQSSSRCNFSSRNRGAISQVERPSPTVI